MPGLDHVRSLLPGVRLARAERLGGSGRSEVVRVRAQWPEQPETSLIVKTFSGSGEGWVRESAALSVLPDETPACRLVTESAQPQTVVLGDLGRGGSIADALLGDDPQAATQSVVSWASAVGAVHRATVGTQDRFRAAVRARAGELPVSHTAMSGALADAAAQLEQQCADLELAVPPGALRALRELARRLGDDNCALTPGDTCPDNNVIVDDAVHLIDFEGAEWRHVAWDVAYLSVPWPSCWCSWRIPGEVADRAVERYRATVEDTLPYVRTAQFRRDVADAATGWALISSAWFLPRALGDDPPPETHERPTPKRRPLILHRLDAARRNENLPELAELAARLRAELVTRWGEPVLAFAPAFEDRSL